MDPIKKEKKSREKERKMNVKKICPIILNLLPDLHSHYLI